MIFIFSKAANVEEEVEEVEEEEDAGKLEFQSLASYQLFAIWSVTFCAIS